MTYYLLHSTFSISQELASVTMRRFLSTSSHREEKQDAAAARRDCALHAWRNLGSPPPPLRTRTLSLGGQPGKPRVVSAGFLHPGTDGAELYTRAVAVTALLPASSPMPPPPPVGPPAVVAPLPRPSFTASRASAATASLCRMATASPISFAPSSAARRS
jgi:hypothetical protein